MHTAEKPQGLKTVPTNVFFNALAPRKAGHVGKYKTLWQSTKGAAHGFLDALREESKIRQVFFAWVGVTVACAIADIGYFQIVLVAFCWMLALVCEIFNTALEKTLDYACGEKFHILVKQGKDYASACTFVTVLFSSFVSLFFLWDRFFGASSF